jgi:hypothetical protein
MMNAVTIVLSGWGVIPDAAQAATRAAFLCALRS